MVQKLRIACAQTHAERNRHMADLALITLHGMGELKSDYYVELQSWLMKRLGARWDRIAFQAVQYAPILQTPEDNLWRAMKWEPSNDLDATKLRKFFLYGFGDAGSLEHSAHRDPEKYLAVESEIQDRLRLAFQELGQDPTKPVVIVAQSLGCQVISNYLWDAGTHKYIFDGAAEDTSPEMEFLRLRSLRNLFTTGCNIPLFVAGLDDRQRFQLPNDEFQWDNYYDPDDVLGWPLAQLGEGFDLINDHAINAGGWLTSWNPASHTKYWTDRDFLKPLASRLEELLEM